MQYHLSKVVTMYQTIAIYKTTIQLVMQGRIVDYQNQFANVKGEDTLKLSASQSRDHQTLKSQSLQTGGYTTGSVPTVTATINNQNFTFLINKMYARRTSIFVSTEYVQPKCNRSSIARRCTSFQFPQPSTVYWNSANKINIIFNHVII